MTGSVLRVMKQHELCQNLSTGVRKFAGVVCLSSCNLKSLREEQHQGWIRQNMRKYMCSKGNYFMICKKTCWIIWSQAWSIAQKRVHKQSTCLSGLCFDWCDPGQQQSQLLGWNAVVFGFCKCAAYAGRRPSLSLPKQCESRCSASDSWWCCLLASIVGKCPSRHAKFLGSSMGEHVCCWVAVQFLASWVTTCGRLPFFGASVTLPPFPGEQQTTMGANVTVAAWPTCGHDGHIYFHLSGGISCTCPYVSSGCLCSSCTCSTFPDFWSEVV